MEPSVELLELLRDIRDTHRELSVQLKRSLDINEQRYQDWKVKSEQSEVDQDRRCKLWEESQELYKQSQALYIRQTKFGVKFGAIFGFIILAGIIAMVIFSSIKH